MPPIDEPSVTDATVLSLQPVVIPDWTDYNGHLNVAYYVRVFDLARDAFLSDVGAGDAADGLIPAASRVEYRQEVHEGRRLTLTTQILAVLPDGLHLLQTIRETESGELAAVGERVDRFDAAGSEWDETARTALTRAAAAHAVLPLPDGWGTLVAETA